MYDILVGVLSLVRFFLGWFDDMLKLEHFIENTKIQSKTLIVSLLERDEKKLCLYINVFYHQQYINQIEGFSIINKRNPL